MKYAPEELAKLLPCQPAKDKSGQKHGRLTVLTHAGKNKNHATVWLCLCDCGNKTLVANTCLCTGDTRSCGCLDLEAKRSRLTGRSHGQSTSINGKKRSPTYQSWCAAKARCHNPRSTGFPSYGAAGIKMCARWRSSFDDFLADMGERPSLPHTLDRFPNREGGYEPGNCRWATKFEQCTNTKKTMMVSVDGERMSLKEMILKFGGRYRTASEVMRWREYKKITCFEWQGKNVLILPRGR